MGRQHSGFPAHGVHECKYILRPRYRSQKVTKEQLFPVHLPLLSPSVLLSDKT